VSAHLPQSESRRWVRSGRDNLDKVLRAIESGAHTAKAIRRLTDLQLDQIVDALAGLISKGEFLTYEKRN